MHFKWKECCEKYKSVQSWKEKQPKTSSSELLNKQTKNNSWLLFFCFILAFLLTFYWCNEKLWEILKCLATCAPTYSIRSENFSYVSWMLYRKEMLTWRRGEKLSSRLLSTLSRAHWSKLILKGNGRNMKLVVFCLITCFRLKIASAINTRNLLRVNHVHCCQGLLLSKQGCN